MAEGLFKGVTRSLDYGSYGVWGLGFCIGIIF